MTKTSSGRARILSQLAVLPVLVFILLALCTDIAAQNTVQEKNKAQDQAPNKTQDADTTKYPVWVGMSIGHTEEGVSPAMVEEYKKIIGKYMKGGRVDWERLKQIPKEERDRLETIYKQMNLEQQSRQEVIFIKRPNPLPKVVPSEKQFAGFKKPDVYGVWIDGKKVSNATLGKYQHTDFSSVFISKLYGAPKKGRSYTHQVDLMTKDYYEEYYRNAMKEPRTSIVVRKLPGKQE